MLRPPPAEADGSTLLSPSEHRSSAAAAPLESTSARRREAIQAVSGARALPESPEGAAANRLPTNRQDRAAITNVAATSAVARGRSNLVSFERARTTMGHDHR